MSPLAQARDVLVLSSHRLHAAPRPGATSAALRGPRETAPGAPRSLSACASSCDAFDWPTGWAVAALAKRLEASDDCCKVHLQLTSGVQRLDNLDVVQPAVAQPSGLRVEDLALDEFPKDLGD